MGQELPRHNIAMFMSHKTNHFECKGELGYGHIRIVAPIANIDEKFEIHMFTGNGIVDRIGHEGGWCNWYCKGNIERRGREMIIRFSPV